MSTKLPKKSGRILESDSTPGHGEAQQSTASAKAPKKDYTIDIFRDWCKSCGICAAFCPRNCIRMDEEGSPVVEDSCRCTGCGWCEVHCPDFAISVRTHNSRDTGEEQAD